MDDVAPDPVPIIVGPAGLTGRTQIARPEPELDQPIDVDEHGRPVWSSPRAMGKAMPPNCIRVRSSPLRHAGCSDCPGRQRDGGCLLDVVRAADAAGVDWRFEIDDRDGFWDYAGDPIPGYEIVKSPERVGAIDATWAPGSEPSGVPADYRETAAPPWFDCPWCDTRVVQDPANFHFWCPSCGMNANDWKEPE